jgi:hypothetical protein
VGPAEDVKTSIGGKIDLPWLTNTCVVRVSRAFNYSGQKIPKDFQGLETVEGGDGLRYAFRVDEFEYFMDKRFGNALIDVNKERFTDSIKDSLGRLKGVIMFRVAGWSDATGHMDLWNGEECATESYFDKANAIKLWVSPHDYNFEGVTGKRNRFHRD